VALCGNCLPTFRDNVSVPSSRVKSPRRMKVSIYFILWNVVCNDGIGVQLKSECICVLQLKLKLVTQTINTGK
jgi:hypothetical protein